MPVSFSHVQRFMNNKNPLYEDHAAAYVKHSARNPVNALYERPAMYAVIGQVDGKDVLDAGCAGGEYAGHLLELGARVTAFDSSAAMVDITRRRLGNRAHVRLADLEQPLEWLRDQSMDVAISSLALHYLRSWDVALSEMMRVLRPAGRLVFSTHHPAMTAQFARNYFETALVTDRWEVEGKQIDVHFFHRPLQTIVHDVLQAGFALRALHEPCLDVPAQNLPIQMQEQLRTRPWFLIVEAEKPARGFGR